MRPILLSVSVLALAAVAPGAYAQNYLSPQRLAGANVVIDFAALDQAGSNRTMPGTHPPFGRTDAPVLRVATPLPVSTLLLPVAPVSPDLKAATSSAVPPARPAVADTKKTVQPVLGGRPAPVRASGFAAADLMDSGTPPAAAPRRPVLAASPVVTPPPIPSAPIPSPAPADLDKTLDAARARSDNAGDRVNLASISTGPALPEPVALPPEHIPPEARPATPPVAKPAPAKADTPAPAMQKLVASLTTPPVTTPDAADASSPQTTHKDKTDDTPRRASLSLIFAPESADLRPDAARQLDDLVKTLRKDPVSRAQIRAYASGSAEADGQARRLSMARALATRAYLVDHDIPATQLDMRALGNGQGALADTPPSGGSLDRVDVVVVK